MAHAELPLYQGGFGKTRRTDAWWVQPLIVFLVMEVIWGISVLVSRLFSGTKSEAGI